MGYLRKHSEHTQLQQLIHHLRGSSFIARTQLKGDTLEIQYYLNYNQYLSENPDTRLTEYDFNTYFETGWAVDKIRTLESVRILRYFPQINRVTINVPLQGKYYSVSVTRKEILHIYGPDVLDMSNDTAWRTQFADRVGYHRKEREKFVTLFGDGPAPRPHSREFP